MREQPSKHGTQVENGGTSSARSTSKSTEAKAGPIISRNSVVQAIEGLAVCAMIGAMLPVARQP